MAAQGKHEDRVHVREEAIKGDVATRRSADDQLAIAALHLSTDQRTVGEDVQRADEVADALRSIGGRAKLGDVIEEAIEVVEDFGRQFDPGRAQGQGRSLRAAGRGARSPRARAFR